MLSCVTMNEPPELVDALRHEPALRRLAWALHLGAADADDAVQHALTQAALGKRPVDMPLATFLRATLRYHAFNLVKLARRRRRREAAVARNEPVPSTATIVARDLLRRRVADAVLALDDPYRTTVWLRWFEGLDVAGVAERMKVPANTVRTRLQRAHARLKQQLDRDHGDREWGLLAAPIALLGAAANATTVYAVALAGAAAVLLAGLVVAGVVVAAPADDVAPMPAVAAAEPVPPALVPVVAPLPPRPIATAPLARPEQAVVEVVDANGKPAANLPVWWWRDDDRPRWTEPPSGRSRPGEALETAGEPLPEPTPLHTDASGRVALPSPRPAAMTVEVASGLWFSVSRPQSRVVLPATSEVRALLVGAPPGTAWEGTCRFAEPHGREWRSLAGVCLATSTTSGPGVIRFEGKRFVARCGETVPVVVPEHRKWFWQFDVSCYGFEIATQNPPRQAPFDAEFRVGRKLPRVIVAVLEPGGNLTAQPGTVRLRADGHVQRRPLVDGLAVFAVPQPLGPKPDLRVLLADGRGATAVTDRGGRAAGRQLSVQIVDTRAPVCIRLRDVRPSEVWRVLLSGRKGWSRVDSVTDELAVGADVVYGLHEGCLWIAGVTEARQWQVAIVAQNGRVALVTTSLFGDGEAWWLPSAPPVDVPLAALFRECGRRPPLRAELAIGLPADDGGTSFQVLWSHDQLADGGSPPVWRSMTLSPALPLRLRVLAGSHGDAAVVLERSTLR
ncbi:MAG TPA: sigma-70 family RNA polymerase sigma factor [Planctomycetota bacterium]|nr:sigma-70 family RNA polymerase sigma factor [Planctomycetota bacterium]